METAEYFDLLSTVRSRYVRFDFLYATRPLRDATLLEAGYLLDQAITAIDEARAKHFLQDKNQCKVGHLFTIQEREVFTAADIRRNRQ